jgi:hypothetical protein
MAKTSGNHHRAKTTNVANGVYHQRERRNISSKYIAWRQRQDIEYGENNVAAGALWHLRRKWRNGMASHQNNISGSVSVAYGVWKKERRAATWHRRHAC